MKTTINYGLKKPDGTDVVNIDDLNYNADILDTKLKEVDNKVNNIKVPVTSVNGKTGAVLLSTNDIKANDSKTIQQKFDENASQLAETTTILTATGTANAIILNVTLQDKKKYSFKAIANSTGAVTINGKPFKKLDGTQIGSGGIKINKVYDFYYDAAANSVFNLAKADGNATVADVLAGKTFSNGDDIGLVGTITNRSGGYQGATMSAQASPTPGIIDVKPYSGYWDGATWGGITDDNYVPANILSGKSIFGLVGTAKEKWSPEEFIKNSSNSNRAIVAVNKKDGLIWVDEGGSSYGNERVDGYNAAGTLVTTIISSQKGSGVRPTDVSDNYILWDLAWDGNGSHLTDKNGTLLKSGMPNARIAYISEETDRIYFDGGTGIAKRSLSNVSLNCGSDSYSSTNTFYGRGLLPTPGGCFSICKNDSGDMKLFFTFKDAVPGISLSSTSFNSLTLLKGAFI